MHFVLVFYHYINYDRYLTNHNIKSIGVIVDNNSDGFSAPIQKGKWSLRASITSELVFDNVFVPDENLLPNVKGLKGL